MGLLNFLFGSGTDETPSVDDIRTWVQGEAGELEREFIQAELHDRHEGDIHPSGLTRTEWAIWNLFHPRQKD